MTPNERRTGPGYRTTPSDVKGGSAIPRPSSRTTRATPAGPSLVTPKPLRRFRPRWHRPAGICALVASVLVAVVNDAMLLGGVPTWLLPGGHNEGYLVAGFALAAWSTGGSAGSIVRADAALSALVLR